MSLTSGNLLISTGILHSGVGLLIPELRDPLLRIATERTTQIADVNDRYGRECSIWFQVAGIMMISQGYLLRNYCQATRKKVPQWFGWYLTGMGTVGVIVMPASGFWLILGQGLFILYQGDDTNDKKSK
uniref:Uncharacterized protein n=1 Tax=Eucampia antarctica TaxID=49252 RepID=A0A7S2RC84_9STRA